MMFFAGFMPTWQEIGSVFLGMFKGIFLNLCIAIYTLTGFLFDILIKITQVDLLSTTAIYQRATMIFTIVITFYIVFEFVKYTVSPDKISDKEKGAMPLFARIIIAILLLAFTPKIFTGAMTLQNRVINTQVFSKVILGNAPEEGTENIAALGRNFSADLFSVFYRYDQNICLNGGSTNKECKDTEGKVNEVIEDMRKEVGITKILFGGLAFTDEFWTQMRVGVEFNPLFGILFGGFMLYVIFMYCKDVALRYVQILFLQIISPLAIISYIAPNKDGMFKKWLKQCTTTYIDIFIRLALLYFMMFVMQAFLTHDLTRDGLNAGLFVKLFIVFALLRFVLKAPKMLEELFPKSGSASIGFGFSAKDRKGILGQAWTGGKQVVAKGAGAIAGVARTGKAMKNGTLTSAADKNKDGKISRMRKLATGANAMIRSGVEGFKAGKDGNVGNAIRTGQEKVQSYEAIVARGGTVLGHDFRAGHYQDEKTSYQVKIDWTKGIADSKSTISNYADEVNFVKQAKAAWESAKSGGASEEKIEELRKNYKKLQKIVITGDLDSDKGIIYEVDKHGNRIGEGIKITAEDVTRKENTDTQIKTFIENAKADIAGSNNLPEDYRKDFEVRLEDADGKIYTKKFSELTSEEIKRSLGDIETAALNTQRNTERKLEYIKANANSEGKK